MSARELEIGLASLSFARRMMLALLDGTPHALWFDPPVLDGNHAAWIAGHIAWDDDDLLQGLIEDRGSKLPQEWHDRFAQGSHATPDSDLYPPPAEIRAKLDGLRAEFIAFFTAASDRLVDPLPEKWHGFAKDLAVMMPAVACHEMLHVGQLTVVRKSLKLEPVFG